MGAKRSQQGSILVFVVLVCAALLMLGASLMDLSGVDLKIALNQRDSLQAHYLAESGIELALAVLAEHNPFYTGSGEISMGEGKINISVNALLQQGGGRLVEITSTGSFGVIQEQTFVSFQSFPVDTAGTAGSVLGWYNAASGLISHGNHEAGSQVVLMGSAASAPLFLPGMAGSGGAAYFSAGQIFFRPVPSSLLVEEKLEIRTTAAVFRGTVRLCPTHGSLHFSHPEGGAIRVYLQREITTTDQHLLLEAGVYNFPHDFQITAIAAPQDMLAYRILPVVHGTLTYRGRR